MKLKSINPLYFLSTGAFFLFIAIITFLSLNQIPYANGWDGYYYLIQVKAYLTEGAMHSSDISLIYPLLIFFEKLIGDYIVSYKICAALIRTFFIAGIFILSLAIISQVKKNISSFDRFTAGLFIASVSLASPSSFFFISQFPKNMFGFALLLFFLSSIINRFYLLDDLKKLKLNNWYTFIIPVILFFATFITHRFAGGLALIAICLFFLLLLIKHKTYKIIITGSFFFLLIILLSVFFPGTLHFVDLERFNGIFNLSFKLTPLSFIQLIGYSKIGLTWSIELFLYYSIVFGFFIALIFLFIFKRNFLIQYYTLLIPLLFCLLGIFPFYNFNLMGMAYRFFLGFVLFAPLLLIPFVMLIPQKRIIPVIIILIVTSVITKNSYDPEKLDPPNKFYYELSTDIVNKLRNTDYMLLVAHKALAEVITFTTGKDALPWKPEKHYERNRIWRIAAGFTDEQLQSLLSDKDYNEYTIPLRKDYQLIREDAWEHFIHKINNSDNPQLQSLLNSWRNPSRVRPDYIRKGRN